MEATRRDASIGSSVFIPGAEWRDTAGRPIEAHTGGFYREARVNYWVGATWNGREKFQAFNLYASSNFQDWTFVRTLLEPSNDLPPNHEIARPKILFNDRNGQYVMWFKRKDYEAPINDVRPGIAVSPALEGPWRFHDDFYPGGGSGPEYNTADFCLWRERDGSAYLIASSPSLRNGPYERRIVIFRLTDDYLGVDPEPVYVGPADDREAPAVFVRNGTYYLITSGTSGWTPNQSTYQTAPSIRGPWSAPRTLGSASTFQTQPDFVFPIEGESTTTFVYAGGRHIAENLQSSRYVWLPLSFRDEEMTLDYLRSWSIDLKTGCWKSC